MSPVVANALAGGAPSAGSADLVQLRSGAGAAVIGATAIASGVVFLNGYVMNIAVPAIGDDLQADVALLQWSVTGFLVAVAALLLVSGAMADRLGRLRSLASGLVVMLGASLLCAVAPSIEALIAARVIQGAGAALVVPSNLAVLTGTLRVADRAPGIGLWAGLATVVSGLGPCAGGWLVTHGSWRWMFLLNVPLIAAALLVLRRVPEIRSVLSRPSRDITGAVLTVGGLGGLSYALAEGPAHGWMGAGVLMSSALAIVGLGVLVPVERRVAAPLLRMSLFASRQFGAINAMTVLLYGALAAAGYLVVLQCELRLGYSPAEAGAALIPQSVAFLVVSPMSGALVARFGPRWLAVWGILAIAAAFVWLGAARRGDAYVAAILPGALLHGVGLGLSVAPLTGAVLASVSDAALGEASAINDVASRVGGVVTVTLVPLLIGATGGRGLEDGLAGGYQRAMLVLAGLCLVAAFVTALFVTDGHCRGLRIPPPAPYHGCAVPLSTHEES